MISNPAAVSNLNDGSINWLAVPPEFARENLSEEVVNSIQIHESQPIELKALFARYREYSKKVSCVDVKLNKVNSGKLSGKEDSLEILSSNNIFIVTAEWIHSTKKRVLELYKDLYEKGAISAEVITDIPAIGRFGDILKILKGNRDTHKDFLPDVPVRVITIAAGIRTAGKIEKLITRAVEADAKALLILSGGGLLRKLAGIIPYGARLLPMDSFKILELCYKLRSQGKIPLGVNIWAVENPLIGNVSERVNRLERKEKAGAEAIIIQPPICWQRFIEWLTLVNERKLTKIPIIVGIPIITSSRLLKFWFYLA